MNPRRGALALHPALPWWSPLQTQNPDFGAPVTLPARHPSSPHPDAERSGRLSRGLPGQRQPSSRRHRHDLARVNVLQAQHPLPEAGLRPHQLRDSRDGVGVGAAATAGVGAAAAAAAAGAGAHGGDGVHRRRPRRPCRQLPCSVLHEQPLPGPDAPAGQQLSRSRGVDSALGDAGPHPTAAAPPPPPPPSPTAAPAAAAAAVPHGGNILITTVTVVASTAVAHR